MNRYAFWTAGLVLVIAAGCAPPPAEPVEAPVDTSADVAAINELANREMMAMSAGDIEAAKAVFAADTIIMPPDEPVVRGHAGLEAWVTAMMEQFTVSGGYTSSEVMVSGDLAVHRYTGEITLTPKAGGDPMTATNKGIHVLRKQADGSWVITQDVWNMDAPASAGGN